MPTRATSAAAGAPTPRPLVAAFGTLVLTAGCITAPRLMIGRGVAVDITAQFRAG